MSDSELLVSLENIIIDKVATVSTVRNRKVDTSAPMEIGMAMKDDCESAREEEEQQIVDLARITNCLQGNWQRKMGIWKRPEMEWNKLLWWQRWQGWRKEFVAKGQRQERQQGTRKRWHGRNQSLLDMWKIGHIAAWCQNVDNQKLYAMDEEESEHAEEVPWGA